MKKGEYSIFPAIPAAGIFASIMGTRTISGQYGGGKKAGTTNAVDLELSKSASNFCIREWEKSAGESVAVAHWFDNSGNPPIRTE
ncbi:hypothetical protein K0M31_018950 [Melipona bicolor]|uniref:Uncharacterized protein n=1 Tax=Melipona bicolor TaxID=60889 RepID=A0AA40FCN4_9HYME|nr:hypothetical protein K0M31_018950 [Melipona bicolor]